MQCEVLKYEDKEGEDLLDSSKSLVSYEYHNS